MKHYLVGKLRYLEDEDIARVIVDGTYEIPPELDETTTYIFQEMGNMGKGTRNSEGHGITITAKDFQTLWMRVSE